MRLTWWGSGLLDDRGGRHPIRNWSGPGRGASFRLTNITGSSLGKPGTHQFRLQRGRELRLNLARLMLGMVPAVRFSVAGVLASLCLVLSGVGVVIALSPAPGVGAVFVSIGGLLGVAALLNGPFCRWKLGRYRARAAELPEVCAACGFDLTGVPPAEDELIVCPECGGAWEPLGIQAEQSETVSPP